MSSGPLCLHHELALLVLNDSKGTFEGSMYTYGFSGAILSEFLLQGVISASESKEQLVTVLDSQPLGDPIMDEALELIKSSDKPRTLQHWVGKIAGMKDLRGRIAEQLAELGIVAKQEAKFLWFFTRTVWPELDGTYEDGIRKRMSESMFSPGSQPESRTAALIALANSCSVLQSNFPPVEIQQHKLRIKEICDGKFLASGATQATIVAIQTAVMAASIASSMAATSVAN